MRSFILALAALSTLSVSAGAQNRVTFPSNDADITRSSPTVLNGLLYKPPGEGPFPAIVLMHGCGGLFRTNGRLTSRHDDWAQRFHGLGYVVLHVDSFTPRGLREICTVKERTIEPSRERARDAYGALLYLQSLPDVQADRIGLMGWSNGGSTTLWTVLARITARPKSLPHGDFRVAVAFYPGCRTPLEYKSGWMTRIPLLILIGERDDWTKAPPCQELVSRAKARGEPVEIVVYPNAFHDFDAPDSPVRVRTGIATTESGTATIGTNPEAREDSIKRAPAFFAKHLRD